MPIVRSSIQSSETLQEFYQRDSWQPPLNEVSIRMLEFISRIDELFPDTVIFASTSHQRLCVHEAGEEELFWVLIVAYSPLGEYYIRYKVPDERSPWENAWMSGEFKTLELAIHNFLKAMRETQSWNGNRELDHALSII